MIEGEQLALPGGQEDSSALAEVAVSEARVEGPKVRAIDRNHRPDRNRVRSMGLFLRAYEKSASMTKAAQEAGLVLGRVRHWRQVYPWFDERLELIAQRLVDRVEDVVIDRALDGTDMATSRWVLERRAPSKWGKSEQKGNGPPLTINIEQNVYDAI